MARIPGRFGRVELGAASGGTELYNSIDLYNWELDTTANLEEDSALDDDWKTFQLIDGEYEMTAAKRVTTSVVIPILVARILSKAVVNWQGKRGGATAAGAALANGAGFITKGGFKNPRGVPDEPFTIKGTGALVAAAT